MICDRCFHSVVCKYADQDYDLEECGEFISRDVVEVKHGEWISQTKFDKILNREIWWAECSACGEKQDYGLPKYCMHCGADMKGGVDNG